MVDTPTMNRQIPLLFTYHDRVVSMGFTAVVSSYGRVLAAEGDGEVWIYGVEPGGIAASGSDPKEALEAFRLNFTNVLRDFASKVRSFTEFEALVQAFFADVNKPNEEDWLRAVEAVRAGSLNIPDVRREPAESRRFVQVDEQKSIAKGGNFGVDGSTIKSSVAA